MARCDGTLIESRTRIRRTSRSSCQPGSPARHNPGPRARVTMEEHHGDNRADMYIALAWMEVGSTIPVSGAIARYPYLSNGGLAGWIMGLAYWLANVSLPAI